jgi:hypothetical protein
MMYFEAEEEEEEERIEELEIVASHNETGEDRDGEIELELEPISTVRAESPDLYPYSRSHMNPSPAISNASSITEVAGCTSNRAESCDSSTSSATVDSHDAEDDYNTQQPTAIDDTRSEVSDNSQSTANSTEESSSAVSEDFSEVVNINSNENARRLITGDHASDISSGSRKSFENDQTHKWRKGTRLNSQPPTIAEDDVAEEYIDGMCGMLTDFADGESDFLDNDDSECVSESGAKSKYSYDSYLGSQYGTEVVFDGKKDLKPNAKHPYAHMEPQKVLTARKPRTLSNHNMGLIPTIPKKQEAKSKNHNMGPNATIPKKQEARSKVEELL